MKKFKSLTGSFLFTLILLFLMIVQKAAGQQAVISSPPIPDNLSKIFQRSCTPCHTTKGSKMAQVMVNFDDWTRNTPEKQASKAGKIYNMVSKGKMPKKSEVEKRPDIVLTKEQIELIKKWSESFKTDIK